MTKFRTTEVSDPEFESNNLRFITVKTNNLKGRGDICVFVPKVDNAKDLPVVILLHGVYGSAWIWAHKAGAHFTANKMIENGDIKPFILAMPSDGLWGDGSAYLPHNGKNFENWIVDDVRHAVLENIDVASKNSTFFISGLSMGGYGALHLGVKYPHIFKAISGHSSITHIDQMPLFVEEPQDSYPDTDLDEVSVFRTILKNKNNLPKIRFDCGKDDLLIEHNRKLHRELTDQNITHVYQEFEGKHEWDYWREHLKDTLLFFDGLI
ncbi:alpha/beta hydrolase-fold protein [Algibacter sp. 2305UL17-15]|uniref:alpha/beta hydrolase n=1 Tax=Algibacter sp. 2305UL17-15 TaxID=3231268 RepID=UPI003459738C